MVYSSGKGYRNIETAAGFLYAELMEAIDCAPPHVHYAGDGFYCDQEGCSNPAIVTYRVKQGYRRDGTKTSMNTGSLRHFCNNHKRRGDGDLEDCDDNYECIREPASENQPQTEARTTLTAPSVLEV